MEEKNLKQKLGVASSQNPDKISLMIKGILTMVFMAAPLMGLDLSEIGIEGATEIIVNVIFAVVALVGLITAVVGGLRKKKLGRWQS